LLRNLGEKNNKENIMAEEKEWRCQKCKAILGMIRWNGSNVPQLMLLRHSLDMSQERPAEVDLIGPLTGKMPVRCECCDHVSVWDISIDALAVLIENLRADQVELLEARLIKGRSKRAETRKARAVME
jgi:hypothetical protein